MSDEPARSGTAPRLLAALLWIGAFWLSLATLTFVNDHFDRISRARQIARYGELPFRDFFDPGYFLTELSSAALQRLLGDNLLGEALLTTAFIATGTLLVFLLAFRLTASRLASLAASVLALLLLPRAYDYDKVLFYPLGLLLCWRFVDRPGAGSTWALAAGLVVAALFRYDTGVYLAAAMVVTMGVLFMGNWRRLARYLALALFAIAVFSLPGLAYIHFQGGVVNAADQVVAYGRRETARTALPIQHFDLRPRGDEGPSPAPMLSAVWSMGNANVLLGYLVRLVPLVAAVWMLRSIRTGALPRSMVAKLASLVTLCVCLNLFILREPVGARLGGMAGPAAILAAWIAHRSWHGASGPGRISRRAALILVLALTVWSVSASADLAHRLQREVLGPASIRRSLAVWTVSPPRFDDIPNRSIAGLVRYLRECTSPDDRVLAAWFAPDVYFYAQRGFAGRTPALFGGHWSEPRFEQRIVEALATQAVPIVLTRTGDERFEEDYPHVVEFIAERYRLAGMSDFGDPGIGKGGYSVWVRKDARAVQRYAVTDLPCF